MAALPPLSMSQKKDDLLRHLSMSQEVYTMMAKETDNVYKWVTSDKRHLKSNCSKRKPPYDWSDMVEKAKDEAMRRIAKSSDPSTSYYWNLGATSSEDDCANWIARWFLYHKFRYRDGRNRNGTKGDGGKHTYSSSSSSSKHSNHKTTGGSEESQDYFYNQNFYYEGSATSGPKPQGYAYASTASSSTSNGYADPGQTYQYAPSTQSYTSQDEQGYKQETRKGYWDPARDV